MPLRIKFKFSLKKGTLRNFPPIIFKDNEKNPQGRSRVGVDYRLPSKEQQWKLEDSSIFSIGWKNKNFKQLLLLDEWLNGFRSHLDS